MSHGVNMEYGFFVGLRAMDRRVRPLLLGLVIVLPFLLIHAPAAAEVVVALLAVYTLARVMVHGDWISFGQRWLLLALAYWVWLVLATLLAGREPVDVALSLAWIRFPLAVLALTEWVLRGARAASAGEPSGVNVNELNGRRVLLSDWHPKDLVVLSLSAACAWICLEVWLQFLFGRGISGPSAEIDGIITGPFSWARAGPFLAVAMWPPLLLVYARLGERGPVGRVVGVLAFTGMFATLLVIGQRMAVLQAVAVGAFAALLLPKLRLPTLAGAGALIVGLLASPVLAPEAFRRLIVELPAQISAFPGGPYGEVWGFWLSQVGDRIWLGLGQGAWRGAVCRGEMTGCHPHSHYLEAFVSAGIPGLMLFLGMSLAFIWAVFRRVVQERYADPIRTGAFLALISAGLAFPALKTMTFIANIGLIIIISGLANCKGLNHLRKDLSLLSRSPRL